MAEENIYPGFERMTELQSIHVPDVKLCRFFQKQVYADKFINGEYRFVNLKEYRQSKYGDRSDSIELEFANNLPDGSSHGGSSTSSCFAMCFTELDDSTDVALLKKRFGDTGSNAVKVDVDDNLELTSQIQSAWEKSSLGNRITYLKWFKVAYNKSDCVESLDPNQYLHVYQKPKEQIIHQMKRVLKKPAREGCVDAGGDVGTIKTFNSLDMLEAGLYQDFRMSMGDEWIELGPKVKSFEVEREWRLVFFSDFVLNKVSQQVFRPMSDRDCFLYY